MKRPKKHEETVKIPATETVVKNGKEKDLDDGAGGSAECESITNLSRLFVRVSK